MSVRIDQELISAVDSGNFALLLGNGIDRVLAPTTGLSWEDFIKKILDESHLRGDTAFNNLLSEKRYLLAAEYASVQLRENTFKVVVRKLIDATQADCNLRGRILLQLIAYLRPKYILTTNYTDLIADGLRKLGLNVRSIAEDEDLKGGDLEADVLPIIHIHGNRENPVLTLSDYFRNMDENPGLYRLAETIFASSRGLALGIELEEAEFDIYQALFRSLMSGTYNSAEHWLYRMYVGGLDNRFVVLQRRFGIKVVSQSATGYQRFDTRHMYAEFYIDVLSKLLEKSTKPYSGVKAAEKSRGLFFGLFTKNVIGYPAFKDDAAGSASDIRASILERGESLIPNDSLKLDKALECPGGGATVAGATYSKLDSTESVAEKQKSAILFSIGPRDPRHAIELATQAGVCLNGVKTGTGPDAISIVINRPNKRNGDERFLLDYRDSADYADYAASLGDQYPGFAEELLRRYLEQEEAPILYFDKWGKSWAELIQEHGNNLGQSNVVFDTGLKGAGLREAFVGLESILQITTHLIASEPAARSHLGCSQGEPLLDKVATLDFEATFPSAPRLHAFVITSGNNPVLVKTRDNWYEVHTIELGGSFFPLNPLGCGDVFRGAYSWALARFPDKVKLPAVLGVLVSFWHLVGGFKQDNNGGLVAGDYKGVPDSLPRHRDLADLLRSNHPPQPVQEWLAKLLGDETIRTILDPLLSIG